VLVEDAGSDDARLVIRRVRAADRLAALLRSTALDRGLAEGQSPDASPALSVRARVLLSPRSRRRTARALRQMPRFLEPAPAAIHARTIAGEQSAAAAFAVEELAQRIEGETPVDVRGVAMTRVLLANGAGSVYCHVPADGLLRAVSQALGALTPE
jgi:hypothetical protein